VLFSRVNDQDVDQAVHKNGFCPLPYLLRESSDGHHRFPPPHAARSVGALVRISVDRRISRCARTCWLG
jgi:hypothetical protein